jgi:hypothetical protein
MLSYSLSDSTKSMSVDFCRRKVWIAESSATMMISCRELRA